MTNFEKAKELLKTMNESERLELIGLCNIENNYRCPYCGSDKICKNRKRIIA